jgi:hypothetical protein
MSNATGYRHEHVTVTDGLGIIEVRATGDGFAEAFFIGGKPISLSWSVSCGSILQNFIRTGAASLVEELKEFRDAITDGLSSEESLASQLRPVLKLLPNGPYLIETLASQKDAEHEDDSDWSVLDFSSDKLNPPRSIDDRVDVPTEMSIVCTVAVDQLDRQRITEFQQIIQSGAQPPIILLRADDGVWDLLIDGHHKVEAYRKLGQVPAFIRITAQEPTRISPNDAEKLIPEDNDVGAYRHSLENWNRAIGLVGWAGTARRERVGLALIGLLLVVVLWVWITP